MEEDDKLDKEKRKIKDSKIQIVSNTFLFLNNKKLGQYNINLNSQEYLPLNPVEKNDKKDNLKSCQQLIDYYFNNDINGIHIDIKNPNYYQKKMFINLLSDQFKKFTDSFYYRPDILIENLEVRLDDKNLAIKKAMEIREFIINSLINNTKLFVKGPYENLIKEQKETDIYQTLDEDQQNQNAINKLAKEKLETMITYDNIKQSIFAFDDLQSSIGIKIIPSSKIGKDEYKQLNDLYNSQNPKDIEIKLEKPREKEKNGKLLNDLFDLLGVEETYKKMTIQKKNEKFGTYVFTTDNYIKMIHILMKTRAKVPIIMMGETGCGKTSLIKMLSLLKNKGEIRMKILNIHEGVGDDEIISFLENTFKITDEEDKNLIIKEKGKYYETYFEDYKEKSEKESNQKNDKKSNAKKSLGNNTKKRRY